MNRFQGTTTGAALTQLAQLACAAAGMLTALSVFAQAYPAKSVRMIVPYTPGATTEVARVILQRVSASLGQSFVVDPRPGGGGTIGTNVVARSAPDGYTLLYSTAGNLLQAPFMVKDVPFHPIKDFTAIIGVVKTVGILAINPSIPVHSVKELIEWGKKNPGKLSLGNSGAGAAYYVGVDLLNKLAGVPVINVPYKGGAEANLGAIAGETTGVIGSVTSLKALDKAGKLRALAVIEGTRFAGLPNLPTVGETIPGFALPVGFHGILGPAGTPRPIVNRLYSEIAASLKTPEVVKALDGFGLDVAVSDPDEFAAALKSDYDLFTRIVKLLDIKP